MFAAGTGITDNDTDGQVCSQRICKHVGSRVLWSACSCPDFTIVLGVAMDYLFVMKLLATTDVAMICVLLSGGACRSAWGQTCAVLRADKGRRKPQRPRHCCKSTGS